MTEEALTIFRELTESMADSYRPELAAALVNLGVRYFELGRAQDALPPTEESVRIFRDLADATPGRHRASLATAVDNLGVWYAEVGRSDDALPLTEEGLTIRRELAGSRPDRFRGELARSLGTSRRPVFRCESSAGRADGDRGSRQHLP